VVIFATWDRIIPILLGGIGGATSFIVGLLLNFVGQQDSATTDLVVITSLASAAIFGPVGALVAHRKHLEWPTGFIFGFGLGLIGFILMLICRPAQPSPPSLRMTGVRSLPMVPTVVPTAVPAAPETGVRAWHPH
jgi:hypothetical protein